MVAEFVVGIILCVIGILFFFNNKNMGKGAANFYKWFYNEKNLTRMYKIAGIVLFVGGLALIFIN